MTNRPPPLERLDLPRLDLGLADLAPDYDLILCDVWGVVHDGVRHNGAAVDALVRFRGGGSSVVLITNAPAPKAQVVQRLDRLGVPRTAYDDVATSGDVTVDLIVEAGCPPLHNIGPDGELQLYDEAARRGSRAPPLVGIEAAHLAICIGPDERETYEPMLNALRERKVPMVCANPDLVVQVGDELVVCAGAIAARYAAMGGKVIQAGKPFPAIYDRALAMAAAIRGPTPARRILAIGDALHTDLQGAHDQGLASLMVTRGIHAAVLHPGGGALDTAALADLLGEGAARPRAAQPRLGWRL